MGIFDFFKKKLEQPGIQNSEKIVFSEIGNWIEKKLMNYQVKRILAGKKKRDETVATKDEIRLHPKKK